MLKKGDGFLVVALLVAVLSAFAGMRIYQGGQENNRIMAVIRYYDGTTEKINLNEIKEPRQIKVPGDFDEVIQVEKGRIRFLEANCPDKICVKTGWIKKNGEMAVCLPNRTMISIQSEKSKGEVDGTTY